MLQYKTRARSLIFAGDLQVWLLPNLRDRRSALGHLDFKGEILLHEELVTDALPFELIAQLRFIDAVHLRVLEALVLLALEIAQLLDRQVRLDCAALAQVVVQMFPPLLTCRPADIFGITKLASWFANKFD